MAQVTLCAVDTRAPALAAQSLLQSMDHVEFARVILFTHGWMPKRVLPGIELVDIDAFQSAADYSRFVMRVLPLYIRTSHALITQWDGFVIDAKAWSPEFLVHDYVGAVWPDQPEGQNVGNGGFSLRSRRFLRACMDPRLTQEHPEDEVLCRGQRAFLEREHGISFAPPKLARRFSFENELPSGPTFGFHGPYHLPRVLDEVTLARWLVEMPEEFFRGRDARRLARAMLLHRMPVAAQRLLQRRREAGLDDGKTRVLSWVAGAMAALRSGKA